MNPRALLFVVTLAYFGCSEEAGQRDPSGETLNSLIELVASSKNQNVPLDLAASINLIDGLNDVSLRVASLVYIATVMHSDGRAFLYKPLQQAQEMVLEFPSQIPLKSKLLLARMWILAEMPWKVTELFDDQDLDSQVKFVDHQDDHGPNFRRLIDLISEVLCHGDYGNVAEAVNSHSTCELEIHPRELMAVAFHDEEDFRRYATVIAANAGAIELPNFFEKPWYRVLFAPPYSLRLGTIFGQEIDGDLSAEQRAAGTNAPLKRLTSPLYDGTPDLVSIGEVLATRYWSSGQDIEVIPVPLDPVDVKPETTLNRSDPKLLLSILNGSDNSASLADRLGLLNLPAEVKQKLGRQVPVFERSQNGFLVALNGPEPIAIYAPNPTTGEYLLLRGIPIPSSGWGVAQLKDLVGDESPELVYMVSQGTSALLSTFVFKSGDDEHFFYRGGVPHGVANFADVSNDKKGDLLINGVIDRPILGCNQCPGVLGTEIYAEGGDQNSLDIVGTVSTRAETEVISATGGGVLAINADVLFLSVLDSVNTEIDANSEQYRKFRQSLFSAVRLFHDRREYALGLSAIQNGELVVDAVGSLEEKLLLTLWKARFLLRLGEIDSVHLLVNEVAKSRAGVLDSTGLRNDLHALMLDLAISENRLSHARQLIDSSQGIDIGQQIVRYQLALGISESSIRVLTDYVHDSMSKSDWQPGMVDALIALAKIHRQTGSKRAPDYLHLAARACRTIQTSYCARLFVEAILVFDDHGESYIDFTREVLATIGRSSNPNTHLSRMSVEPLLTGGEASKEKLEELKNVFFRFEDSDLEIAIDAATVLSQQYGKLGDFDEALFWSNKTLSKLEEGRRRFTSYQEQATYLRSKEQYDHHFQLLDLAQADARHYLTAMERVAGQILRDSLSTSKSTNLNSGVFQDFSQNLASEDALVNFYFGTSAGYAVVSTGASKPVVVKLDIGDAGCRRVSKNVLSRFAISDHTNVSEIRGGSPSESTVLALRAASQQYLDPLNLPRNTTRIFVSADECQAGLPWSALVLESGEYAVDKYAITTVVPLKEIPQVNVQDEALIIAAHRSTSWLADDGESVRPDFPPLTSETASIAESLSKVGYGSVRSVLNGIDTATQKALPVATQLQAMENAGLIHVSAHGSFDPLEPEKSYIVMDDGQNSKALIADDVSRLNLEGVHISFSACESGSLSIEPLGEPAGFVRAAILAGATSGLFTNWQVDDRATNEIFGQIYSEHVSLGLSGAYRQAQLRVRQNYPHPYFWAGLALVHRL